MMGYYGNGFGWMWLWGLLLLLGIAALVLLAVRLFSGANRGNSAPTGPASPYGAPPYGQPGAPPGGPGFPGGRSQARLVLDERFARGELTAEQYRENLKVLGEEP